MPDLGQCKPHPSYPSGPGSGLWRIYATGPWATALFYAKKGPLFTKRGLAARDSVRMSTIPWLWAVFTIVAAGGQTMRNAMQRHLIGALGTVGATHVRFLFGLPFAVVFLVLLLVATGEPLPTLTFSSFAWTTAGAIGQMVATALMLAAMRDRSFVVTIAYTKTEPVQVALFGVVMLGDHVTLPLAVAIVMATAGVLVVSWPKKLAEGEVWSWRPAILGMGAGGLFAIAAVGFRGGIIAMEASSFLIGASATLVLGLCIQTVMMSAYLLVRDRAALIAIFRAWRPSMFAGFMGAFASQLWFFAFAIESAARVRTLALVEIFFAQLVSRNLFGQGLSLREGAGIALLIVGVILLFAG